MNEIKKYERYAGVKDRFKVFLLEAGIAISSFFLLGFASVFIIIFLSFFNLYFYFSEGRSLTYKIFNLLIIDEKTGERPGKKVLMTILWNKVGTFIKIILITIFLLFLRWLWLEIPGHYDLDMIKLYYIIEVLSAIVLIVSFILESIRNLIIISKSHRKQSWYEKKARVLVVKEKI